MLYDEAVTRNAGNSAIGSDRVVLAFEAYDVGLDHPNVMWGMWSQGHKEQITSDDYTFDASAVDWNDFRDPLKDFWASRPPRALHEKVQPTSVPTAPGHRRIGDEALAWVRDRAERRGERDKKSTVWPVAVYRGKWKLSRRCIVTIKLTERVESAWAEVTFNPSRLHDPLGTSVCPSELVEAYGKALLMRLAAENILVRSCPHLLATVESCETPSRHGGAPAQGGRATRAKAVPTQPASPGFVCLDPACLAGSMPERKPVEAKIMARGLLNPRDHTRVPAPLMGVLVRQLHATSDFTDVRDMSLPLDIMRSSRHYDAKSKQTYKSSVLLSTGKSGWRLTGYDKHAETVARRQGVLAPRGTFRFEAKLMSNVLRTERLTHLPDLTADRINRVFLKGFVKAGLDRAYGGQSPLRRHRLPGMSRFITTQLYRRLDACAAGEDWTPQDQATERGYATRAARHGFVFGRGSRERLGPHRHLDPVEGRERPPTTAWMEFHAAERWESAASRRRAAEEGVSTTPRTVPHPPRSHVEPEPLSDTPRSRPRPRRR